LKGKRRIGARQSEAQMTKSGRKKERFCKRGRVKTSTVVKRNHERREGKNPSRLFHADHCDVVKEREKFMSTGEKGGKRKNLPPEQRKPPLGLARPKGSPASAVRLKKSPIGKTKKRGENSGKREGGRGAFWMKRGTRHYARTARRKKNEVIYRQ